MKLNFSKILCSAFLFFERPQHYISYHSCKKWLHTEYSSNFLYGGNHSTPNCEHIVPKSILKKNEMDPRAQNDLHILWLVDSKINSHRQNYTFSKLNPQNETNIKLDNLGMKIEHKKYHCMKNVPLRQFDPPSKSKGIIARSVGYFYFTYTDTCVNDLLDMKTMIEWHKKYPVSKMEQERNQKIFEIQRNRNLFIDYPIFLPIYFSKWFKETIKFLKFKKIEIQHFFSKWFVIFCKNKTLTL